MNKLAVLAFALLMFFSTMLWYLANGSLNDYLKSQVTLQSQYYLGQNAHLESADFSADKGITVFTNLSISNTKGSSSPLLFSINNISASLAQQAVQQLNSPSIQNKTTTLVHITSVKLDHLQAWSENVSIDKDSHIYQTNLEASLQRVVATLANDYPASYPEISAKIYAEKYPERSESLVKEKHRPDNNSLSSITLETPNHSSAQEVNQAIIESKAAKKEKRILGKAQIRVRISSLVVNTLTLHTVHNNQTISKTFYDVPLGSFGENENQGILEGKGLASNQLGGEILRRLLTHLISLEKEISSAELEAH